MMTIDIYTKATCFYCMRAKALLDDMNITYNEIKIDGDAALREKMIKRSQGSSTVPQIFINDAHIGGCDDLLALNAQGKLASLLAQ
ncbi:glutaredoxin 3 [Colwellia sp. Arc7-635]|uniref:glutaredoxin 3 n=1 Tax=Colwellia sp. Arc7-635 TaxID=2497879 RepID=UPI000F854D5D|nr:glutaredoxin 3 [Colwellia sp. Arc7-635]AZQ82888.1 glutaredoxin 3 [Colwellia sp. Arc7-635]